MLWFYCFVWAKRDTVNHQNWNLGLFSDQTINFLIQFMFIVHVSSIVFPILCILCTLPCTYKHVYLTWILFIPVIGALLSHPCMLPSRMVRNQLQKCGCHTQNGNHLLKTLLHSCWWSKVQQGNHKNNQQINQQRQNSLSLEVNSFLQENMEKCNYLFLTAWTSTGGK